MLPGGQLGRGPAAGREALDGASGPLRCLPAPRLHDAGQIDAVNRHVLGGADPRTVSGDSLHQLGGKPSGLRHRLAEARHRLGREPGADPPALGEGAEHPAGGEAGRGEPGLHGGQGIGRKSEGDAGALRVGCAAAAEHRGAAVRRALQVLDREGDQWSG